MFELRKSSDINIWWNSPNFQSQLSCVLACSPPVFHIDVGGLYATPGAKIQAARPCLMACDQPEKQIILWSLQFFSRAVCGDFKTVGKAFLMKLVERMTKVCKAVKAWLL